ncbi:MAG TPA: hypothetical protein VIT41_15800 [Microlunatus sp.]
MKTHPLYPGRPHVISTRKHLWRPSPSTSVASGLLLITVAISMITLSNQLDGFVPGAPGRSGGHARADRSGRPVPPGPKPAGAGCQTTGNEDGPLEDAPDGDAEVADPLTVVSRVVEAEDVIRDLLRQSVVAARLPGAAGPASEPSSR